MDYCVSTLLTIAFMVRGSKVSRRINGGKVYAFADYHSDYLFFRLACDMVHANPGRVETVARCMVRRGIYPRDLHPADLQNLRRYFTGIFDGNLGDWIAAQNEKGR